MSREEVFKKLNEVSGMCLTMRKLPSRTPPRRTISRSGILWSTSIFWRLMEQEFGMKFNMGQVVSMKNVGEMVDIILERMP